MSTAVYHLPAEKLPPIPIGLTGPADQILYFRAARRWSGRRVLLTSVIAFVVGAAAGWLALSMLLEYVVFRR